MAEAAEIPLSTRGPPDLMEPGTALEIVSTSAGAGSSDEAKQQVQLLEGHTVKLPRSNVQITVINS